MGYIIETKSASSAGGEKVVAVNFLIFMELSQESFYNLMCLRRMFVVILSI